MTDKDHFHDKDSIYDKQNAYHNEEYARELAADQYNSEVNGDRDEADHRRVVEGGGGLGWLALILSVIGLFFMPIVLGIAGIIIGYIALRQGARTLGGWAIGIGCLAVLIQLLSPLFW
ncbi:hypothetical protein M3N64_00315 [Sporolactobacillus sp. CPB3-1]|uniref:DUF4190 domain-containing protein n=1 Tax=Sporolactobacillus mangiferae TaxID=2940498 RepID=A0ABT0M6A7_9BACL|nr:hypothetical protein [Sporolactobacillus mangiferae]